MNGENMKTQKFGSTDLTVSGIGMGTLELGGREWEMLMSMIIERHGQKKS